MARNGSELVIGCGEDGEMMEEQKDDGLKKSETVEVQIREILRLWGRGNLLFGGYFHIPSSFISFCYD